MSSSLSISCVAYLGDLNILRTTIKSLAKSCHLAVDKELLSETILYLIDNGPDRKNLQRLECLSVEFSGEFSAIIIKTGHGNVGYGRGHNLAILEAATDYHLVLNPDVILAIDNISIALSSMTAHQSIGLLAPDAFDERGQRQYIAKREPSLGVLLCRALDLGWLRRYMATEMDLYEYRDLIPANKLLPIKLASGCYMMMPSWIAKEIGGFDHRFFMYFEDFDLSLRIAKDYEVVHHPNVHIVHMGGGASSKGWRHIGYFLSSYLKFRCRYFLV